ncbi:hypothetical protein ADUPG1_006162, partial [Aduncisulcus paluster]
MFKSKFDIEIDSLKGINLPESIGSAANIRVTANFLDLSLTKELEKPYHWNVSSKDGDEETIPTDQDINTISSFFLSFPSEISFLETCRRSHLRFHVEYKPYSDPDAEDVVDTVQSKKGQKKGKDKKKKGQEQDVDFSTLCVGEVLIGDSIVTYDHSKSGIEMCVPLFSLAEVAQQSTKKGKKPGKEPSIEASSVDLFSNSSMFTPLPETSYIKIFIHVFSPTKQKKRINPAISHSDPSVIPPPISAPSKLSWSPYYPKKLENVALTLSLTNIRETIPDACENGIGLSLEFCEDSKFILYNGSKHIDPEKDTVASDSTSKQTKAPKKPSGSHGKGPSSHSSDESPSIPLCSIDFPRLIDERFITSQYNVSCVSTDMCCGSDDPSMSSMLQTSPSLSKFSSSALSKPVPSRSTDAFPEGTPLPMVLQANSFLLLSTSSMPSDILCHSLVDNGHTPEEPIALPRAPTLAEFRHRCAGEIAGVVFHQRLPKSMQVEEEESKHPKKQQGKSTGSSKGGKKGAGKPTSDSSSQDHTQAPQDIMLDPLSASFSLYLAPLLFPGKHSIGTEESSDKHSEWWSQLELSCVQRKFTRTPKQFEAWHQRVVKRREYEAEQKKKLEAGEATDASETSSKASAKKDKGSKGSKGGSKGGKSAVTDSTNESCHTLCLPPSRLAEDCISGDCLWMGMCECGCGLEATCGATTRERRISSEELEAIQQEKVWNERREKERRDKRQADGISMSDEEKDYFDDLEEKKRDEAEVSKAKEEAMKSEEEQIKRAEIENERKGGCISVSISLEHCFVGNDLIQRPGKQDESPSVSTASMSGVSGAEGGSSALKLSALVEGEDSDSATVEDDENLEARTSGEDVFSDLQGTHGEDSDSATVEDDENLEARTSGEDVFSDLQGTHGERGTPEDDASWEMEKKREEQEYLEHTLPRQLRDVHFKIIEALKKESSQSEEQGNISERYNSSLTRASSLLKRLEERIGSDEADPELQTSIKQCISTILGNVDIILHNQRSTDTESTIASKKLVQDAVSSRSSMPALDEVDELSALADVSLVFHILLKEMKKWTTYRDDSSEKKVNRSSKVTSSECRVPSSVASNGEETTKKGGDDTCSSSKVCSIYRHHTDDLYIEGLWNCVIDCQCVKKESERGEERSRRGLPSSLTPTDLSLPCTNRNIEGVTERISDEVTYLDELVKCGGSHEKKARRRLVYLLSLPIWKDSPLSLSGKFQLKSKDISPRSSFAKAFQHSYTLCSQALSLLGEVFSEINLVDEHMEDILESIEDILSHCLLSLHLRVDSDKLSGVIHILEMMIQCKTDKILPKVRIRADSFKPFRIFPSIPACFKSIVSHPMVKQPPILLGFSDGKRLSGSSTGMSESEDDGNALTMTRTVVSFIARVLRQSHVQIPASLPFSHSPYSDTPTVIDGSVFIEKLSGYLYTFGLFIRLETTICEDIQLSSNELDFFLCSIFSLSQDWMMKIEESKRQSFDKMAEEVQRAESERALQIELERRKHEDEAELAELK